MGTASELADSAAEAFAEAERVRQELPVAESTMARTQTLCTPVTSETTPADAVAPTEAEVAAALRSPIPHARRCLRKSKSQSFINLSCPCKPPWLIEMTGPCKVHSSP